MKRTAILILTILNLISCSKNKTEESTSASQSEPEVLHIYTARHYETDRRVFADFAVRNGIEIQLIEGKGSELEKRIRAEGELCPGDIFLTVDIGRIWKAEQSDFFHPVESAVLTERIPEHLRHSNGLWFGLTKRARVLFYAKDRVNPNTLSTYEALAEPEFKGKILIRSSSNVYNQSLLASLITHHGRAKAKKWAAGMVSNFARTPQSNDTGQLRALAAGEGDVAIANTYYYFRLLKSEKPEDQEVINKIDMFFPNQDGRGAHVNISGAGVLKHSKNKEAAIKFIEYMTSDFAQELLAKGNNEYPVVSGVAADDKLNEFPFKEDKISAEDIGKNSPLATKVFDEVGWR